MSQWFAELGEPLTWGDRIFRMIGAVTFGRWLGTGLSWLVTKLRRK